MNLEALVNGLVGKPYHPDGRGPDRWGCWHLARHVLAEGFGIRLPAFAVYTEAPGDAERLAAAAASGDFERTAEEPGVLALMGRSPRLHHVGAVLERGVIVHADRRAGVVVASGPLLAREWPHRQFWRYAGRVAA